QGDYVYAEIPKPRLVAAKPTPGMNASGSAVKAIVDRWNVDLPEMLVIVDDVDLPLGTLRIRPHGGDGCHRGMESVIYHLKDNRFPRLRFGIATDEDLRPAENYVLKPFRKQDRRLAEEMVSTAADAVETIVYQGLNKAMNLFNRTNKTMENYS
ncbi:MAG: aminoacyl-tRNA hydrolase, partial [Fidelibacterota bacterium]